MLKVLKGKLPHKYVIMKVSYLEKITTQHEFSSQK